MMPRRPISFKALIFASAISAGLVACTAGEDNTGTEYAPNMYHSVPYEPLSQITDEESGEWVSSIDNGVGEYYNSNPNNPHGMTMREPAPHTVRRTETGYIPYRIPKDSLEMAARLLINPLDSTKSIVDEGKELYGRFCIHCHGDQGQAPNEGSVGEVYGGVAAYNSAAVKDKPGGHIFQVITHGKGRMGAHGSQISIEDRWKIVRYVQVLQKK